MAKEYEVIGLTNVHGFDPGQRFHADLEPEHEARMLKGKFLRLVPPRERKFPPVAEASASEEPDKNKEE